MLNLSIAACVEPERLSTEEASKLQALLDPGFKAISKLGEGSNSTVYRCALNRGPDRMELQFALKKFKSTYPIELILNELRHLLTVGSVSIWILSHFIFRLDWRNLTQIWFFSITPIRGRHNIVRLFKGFREHGQISLLLEYFEHDTFEACMDKFSTNDISRYIYELLSGLQQINSHRIIHSNIKPAHVLFSVHKQKALLIDFGFATTEGSSVLSPSASSSTSPAPQKPSSQQQKYVLLSAFNLTEKPNFTDLFFRGTFASAAQSKKIGEFK